MSDTLRSTLQDLQNTIQSKEVSEANHLVNDIRSSCLSITSAPEIGLSCSLLFQNDESLLKFIKRISHLNEFGRCLDNCLVFLQEFIPRAGHAIYSYVENIVETCTNVCRTAKLSANKEKAISIMIRLIEISAGKSHTKTLDVEKLRKLCNEELAKRSGTTSTVKGSCFHTLGIIAEYYPEKMINQSERMFDVYLRELKKEMQSQKSSDHKIIEGCLKGLSCLMVNFTKSIEEDSDTCKEIYKFTMMSIQPKTDLARYAVPAAGLQILQRHFSQFGHLITDNYESIYVALQRWFSHNNTQMKHEAHVAISSFLHQVVASVTEDLKPDQAKKLFVYFINKFQEMLDTPDATNKVLSVAIQGFGLFAGLCKKYMPPGDVQKMFSMMIEKCEKIYLGEVETGENKLYQLPSFLQSLANIVREMIGGSGDADEASQQSGTKIMLTESFERSLCRLCVLMIGEYPRLNKKFVKSCCGSLISLMSAFAGSPDSQNSFVSKIVYQGLIRCCSHQVVLGDDRDSISVTSIDEDTYKDIMSDSRTITYRDYISLWNGLICPGKGNTGVSFVTVANRSERRTVQEMMYSELLSSIIVIISKLNLSSKPVADEHAEMELSSDEEHELPSQATSAENIVDFQVFVNLTDLCRDLLPILSISDEAREITEHVFKSRVNTLVKELIKQSTRFPNVSGFYKLLATTMEVCTMVEYFSPIGCRDCKNDTDSVMDVSADNVDIVQGEIVQCATLIKKFVPEVASHLLQWKDDLLASCLLFVLSLPSELAADIMNTLILPLQTAFRLGLSYTLLAEAGMNAMERWRDEIKSSSLINTFAAVLPDIEPFLHAGLKQVSSSNTQQYSSNKKKRVKMLTVNIKADIPALEKVRNRAIKFLGSMGGLAHACLEKSQAEESDKLNSLVVWDKDASIPYAVPFQELKTDIQLELLLPRIAELASQSAVRRVKVASCEVLHSMTVYIIGRNSQQDVTIQKQNPVTGLYKQVFPVILKLACDVEQVSKQLFEPLVMQMIHWFTNNRKYESPDTVVLLNAIINGLVDESDAALRDLCARSVREFLVWSIKQNVSSKDTARKNAKSLLKRLYNLAQHPSAGKRLGSATAFNHIYRVFREQEKLVDEFTLELMVIYINSLAMSHNDEKAMGTQKACSEVLSHVQRIVQAKKDIFNKESKVRRAPPGFNHKKPVVISTVVEWLLNQCSCPQTECRHQCMQLFYSFVPLLPESMSVKQWLQKRIGTGGKNLLIACFEGGSQRRGISLHPQMMLSSDGSQLKSALNWFDLVLASLDCYTWVFQQKLLTPTEVFQGDGSKMFRCIDHILHDIARQGIADVVKSSDVFTPSEQESFNESKCTVIVRILQFTLLMLRQYTKECLKVFPKSLWETETLFGTVALCCINPSAIGFNIEADVRIAEQLPLLVSDIVSAMAKHLPENLKNAFVAELKKEIFKNGSLTEQLQHVASHTVEANLVSAYKILQQGGLLPIVLLKTKIADEKCLAKELCNHVFKELVKTDDSSSQSNILISMTQSTIQFNSQLLQLALDIGVAADFLVQLVVDSSALCDDAGTVLVTKHGQAFFSTYRSVLCAEMCLKSSMYIQLITMHCSTKTSTCTTVLSETLEYLFKDRQCRKKYSAQVCNNVLKDWGGQLSYLWKPDSSSVQERSAALTIFTKIVTLDSTVCKDTTHPAYAVVFEMFNGFLTSATLPLSFKSQVLPLLSFFCMSADDARKSEVKRAIFELCSLHFPSRSYEFEPGSTRYADYVFAVKKLLLAMELTGNAEILEVLISIMCREEHHVLADEFQSTLGKCLRNVEEGSQKLVLDVPYKLFSDSDSHHPVTVKCRTISQVFVPLISQCSTNTAKEFFTKHIGNIMQYIMEDNQRYSNEKWKDQLEMKTCCYKLAEIMFSMLPAEDFKTDSSPIVQSFAASPAGAGSTKLLKAFMGRVVRDKNEDMTGESELLEDRRKFHCAVYNAVISAVICTQGDIKWFDAFLFSDNPKKKEFLFDNIIDKTRTYSFPIETDEPLEKRKKFISIRKTHRDIARAQDSGYQSIAYVSSLAGSSLSEDVNQFDNNMSRTLQERPDLSQSANFGFSVESTDVVSTSGSYVELEKDEINDHECMSNLISLLMHMHENNIGFTKIDENAMETDQGPSTLPPPKWMTVLIRKFTSSSHLNVKIFIAKLITNCENIFRLYAEHFIAPMLKVVLANFKKVNEAGDAYPGIDQFAVDTVVTLLSWSSVAIPKDDMEEKILTRALIEALMKNMQHEQSKIVRHNLELLKTTIECWRPRISDLNTDIVFHQCGSTDTKSQDNFTGLQLLGALLANGLPPYTPSVEVDREVYFRRIFNNVLFSRKAIIDTASEVMGLSLKHLAEEQKETEGEIHDIAHRIMEKLSNSSKSGVSGFGVFISSLHRISRHYPPTAELFLSRILFNLPKLPATEMKMKCIDIICSCIDKIPDLLAELKAKDFLSMLIHRDETLQHSCLKLCSSLVQKTITWDRNGHITNIDDIDKHQKCVEFFFPSVEKYFQNHPSPICRQVMYDLAMEIYDIQKSFPIEHQAVEAIKNAKLILLRGLHDTEEVLRNQIVNFWSEENLGHHKVRLAADPAGKLLGLLGDLYQPETEEFAFIASACNLIMQAASRSPDFERAIFENPLSECIFQEVSVDHTWQHRHSTMNPMFVETMQSSVTSSSSFSPSPDGSSGQRKPRMLQATQVDLQFSATVDVTGKNTYNWMTGGSVDTFSSLAVTGPERSSEQGQSVLLAAKPRKRTFRPAQPVGPDFGKHQLKSSNEGDHHLDIARLRRRFQKETSASQYQYARVAARKDKEKQKHIKQENAKREHAVQLYRTYRLGELPDIEIPHRCVVAPLAALAQLDPVLSQRLLSSLIHAIINEQTKKSDEYIVKISEAFARVLSSSQQCNSSFIGSILAVILKNASKIKINPSVIAQAAVKAKQHLLGIRVIEEWLIIQQEPKEPTSKRRKLLQESNQVSEDDMLAWIELARLYQKDFDTLRGIFTGTPVARSLFGEAIRFETQCEFSKAMKIYQNALIEEVDPKPSDVEKDLWEDCLLNCLKKLGKWQEVSDFCDAQTDNSLDNAWEDANFLERFLSTSLHAKMLLLSRGSAECGSDLMSFIENSIKHGKERKNLIESKYSDHIAMLYINQEDYNQANFYIQKATNAFAEEWSEKDSQTDMLSKVVHLSDITDFNSIMRQNQGKQISANTLMSLVDRWANCLPHPLYDSVNVWEDMLTYRSYFLNHLVQKYSSNSSTSSQDDDAFMSSVCLQESIARKKLILQLKSVENSCRQKHYTLARKFLNDDVEEVLEYIRSLDGADGVSEEVFLQAQTMSKYYLSFASHIMLVGNKSSDWIRASKAVVEARSFLLEEIEEDRLKTDIRALKLLGQTYDLASEMVDRYVENETVRENLGKMLQDGACQTGVLKDDLRSNAQKYFEDGIKICSEGNIINDDVAENFWLYAKYCDKILQEKDENCGSQMLTQSNCNEFAENTVKFTLRAMKHHNIKSGSDASLKFPRLLQLVDAYPDVKPCFLRETSQLSSWMFLQWISQMVALLDKGEADAIHDVISRLAGEYPQAVIYPVKTSCPDFNFLRTETGKKNKCFVKKLQTELDVKVPIVEPFIKNLTLLTNPAHTFSDWCDETARIYQAGGKSKNRRDIITKYQNMYNEMFASNKISNTEEDDELYGMPRSQSITGNYRRTFADKFRKKVEQEFGGSTGAKLSNMDQKLFGKTRSKLLNEMKEYCKNLQPKTLKEYSRWLCDFHSLNLGDQELEIPGQYKGSSKPMVEYHTKISGFEDVVLVLSSLQQPKRITIKASDSHEYQYLVKGNEDLRQDQRIQQVFEAMNKIFYQDQNCAKRSLHIDTYKVIPVTSRLGLIEWVPKTETLQCVVNEEARQVNRVDCLDKANQVYSSWLNKFTNDRNKTPYGKMMEVASHTETCNKYKEVVAQVPQGLLRNAYLRLSSTPEAFLALRQKFASSYGTLCVAHWILGIGDRHTSNCMISKKTGAAVGIDFGHAFGTATECLPVPELMPFRLSPQICYLMAPHPAKHGVLRQCMVFCLAALRAEQETILGMLDVFLKEPSVDWMKFANKMVDAHGSGVTDVDYGSRQQYIETTSESVVSSLGTSSDTQWYPRRKIGIVKKKLSGCKPSTITEDELQHSQVQKKLLQRYRAVVVGLNDKNLRAAYDDQNLSVDDQVDCLIDQATDPNLLGRTYIGWRFWL